MTRATRSLAEELADFNASFLDKAPDEVVATMAKAGQELEQLGIVDNSLNVGDEAPDFELPSAKGGTVRLSEKLKDGPVVLNFYRGDWCPYCNLELRAFQAALPDFEAKGASLVAISPQTPDNSLTTAEKRDLEYHVLSDVGNAVARDFGLVFSLAEELRPLYDQLGIDIPAHNGDGTFELPVPATYVVGQDGKISYAFVNTDYTKRAEPSEVLEAIA